MKYIIILLSFFMLNCSSTPNLKRMASKVVKIKNKMSRGSGLIYKSSESGTIILTNNHVCDGTVTHSPTFVFTNNNKMYRITKYKMSDIDDLCMVHIDENLKLNTKLADKSIKLYDKVINMSRPRGMPLIITEGFYSSEYESTYIDVKNQKKCSYYPIELLPLPVLEQFNKLCKEHNGYFPRFKSVKSYVLSVPIMPGASGSPVFNYNEELVSIIKQARFTEHKVIGFGISITLENIKTFVDLESKGEKWIKAK